MTATEVDNQGRPTKVTYPGGRVDYTTYNDSTHETRAYRGWDAATGLPTGPTAVGARRPGGRVHGDADDVGDAGGVRGAADGGRRAVSGVQSLAREYRNAANQVVTSDAYYDLTGVAYTTAAMLGVQNVNFLRTLARLRPPGAAEPGGQPGRDDHADGVRRPGAAK